ncbi:ABC transporter permease [Pseudoscardovia radai]|uniref:ABC transporter permease n=1 Tax=Pseudoscardovia radai TaxID=987066 RepID=UPI003994AD0D
MQPRKKRSWIARTWPAVVTFLALVVIWQIVVDRGLVSPRQLSSPTQIVRAAAQSWNTLSYATWVTFVEGALGFAIAIAVGILLGVGLHCSRAFHAAVYPLLVGAQTLPIIAIAPLFLLWFGFEPLGKLVLVAVFATFPIAVQTCRGLDSVPRFYRDVALTCGATSIWTLWHVELRVAARQVFGGIRISAAYVFGTAATAEYMGARAGLGIWLQAAYNSFRTPLIFAASLVIVLMTVALMLLVSLVERLLLGPDDDAIE